MSNLATILLFFTSLLAIIAIWALFTRWWVDTKKRTIQHVGQFFLHAMAFFANSFIYYRFDPPYEKLAEWTALQFLQAGIYWVLFDLLLNKLRGRSLKYVSQSNLLDKFFHRYTDPFKSQMIAKISVILISAILVILL